MDRQNISSGMKYEAIAGYSRAVRVGNIVHVAGTTAIDGESDLIGAGDVSAQTDFVIQKIERALQQAGAELKDVVRTRIYITPGVEWEAVLAVHGKYFAEIRPVATLVYVHALINDDYLVEIEAEAILSE